MKTLLSIAILAVSAVSAAANDWSTYGHDNRRSHVTSESLGLPLVASWVYRSPSPPQTAWTGPAKWDAYASNEGLQSMRNFDPAFFVSVAGERVFFGSSVDNAAHCLDAKTGEEQWLAFADGAVRLPPTWHDGKAYFGADDGCAYCVEAETGKLVWRFRAVDEAKMIPSNGKLISPWPVRTGVLIDQAGEQSTAFFGASLFPWQPSHLCAVDAVSGEKVFMETQSGITLQGAMLASSSRLFAPQGRSVPLVYAKATGSPLGQVGGSGGVFCILTEEELLISMPNSQKSKEEVVQVTNTQSPGTQSMLSIAGADRMLVHGKWAYFHQRGQLKAIDRFAAMEAHAAVTAQVAKLKKTQGEVAALKKSAQPETVATRIGELERSIPAMEETVKQLEAKRGEAEVWRTPGKAIPSALILAGDYLFLGGDGVVSAVAAATGEEQWTAAVEGRVYGLAVANGHLFVSTDRGGIYAFAGRE